MRLPRFCQSRASSADRSRMAAGTAEDTDRKSAGKAAAAGTATDTARKSAVATPVPATTVSADTDCDRRIGTAIAAHRAYATGSHRTALAETSVGQCP